MRAAVKIYVALVCLTAIALSVQLGYAAPHTSQQMLQDAFVLGGLAATAELLAYLLPRAALGSIGYIPYFAAAIIMPAWPSVAAAVAVRAAVELWQRRAFMKSVLNVSAYAIMEVMVVRTYLVLGGQPLGSIDNLQNLLHVTRAAAAPALIAFLPGFIACNLIVTQAIALSTNRPLVEILKGNHNHSNAGLDFLSAPLIFVFAWVFAAFGVVAAATLWVPILGLRQFHRTNLELEQTNEELLELMVKSIEARDPYTSGHSRRVRQFSMTIARAIGLSESKIEEVGRAALLHDVGKIYEKYAAVISKQDKLTPEEWSLIQDHPGDGANLVATMTRLRDLVPAVRHHHENWDGTGYPDRIAGEAIPLGARIIRFADTIDAMTTLRPYRRPLSEAQVRAEVIRCRGTQFDPQIADRLLASPLWHTLFAPESNATAIGAPLSVVASITGRDSGAAAPKKLLRRA